MIRGFEIIAALLAGSIIMILHEFVKAATYMIFEKSQRSRKIFRLHQYIDPIGLLFCFMSKAGFSKTYPFKFRSRKTIFLVGVIGMFSLMAMSVLSIGLYRHYYRGVNAQLILQSTQYVEIMKYLVLYYFMMISTGTFIVNLFPITTFDIGLLIASVSPGKFLGMIRADFFIKFMLIGLLSFHLIKEFAYNLIVFLIRL